MGIRARLNVRCRAGAVITSLFGRDRGESGWKAGNNVVTSRVSGDDVRGLGAVGDGNGRADDGQVGGRVGNLAGEAIVQLRL